MNLLDQVKYVTLEDGRKVVRMDMEVYTALKSLIKDPCALLEYIEETKAN